MRPNFLLYLASLITKLSFMSLSLRSFFNAGKTVNIDIRVSSQRAKDNFSNALAGFDLTPLYLQPSCELNILHLINQHYQSDKLGVIQHTKALTGLGKTSSDLHALINYLCGGDL